MDVAEVISATTRISFGGMFCFVVAIGGVVILVTLIQSRRFTAGTERKHCPGCSTPNPPHAEYCRNCGRKL